MHDYMLTKRKLERERERILYLYTATSKQVLRRGG